MFQSQNRIPTLAILKKQQIMSEVVCGIRITVVLKPDWTADDFIRLNTNLTSWEAIAAEAQYRPTKMAKLCCVSLRTIQRHFRKNYNLPVKNWIRSVQMLEAKRLILEGSSMKAVSYELGFKQPSHFSRVFKGFYGIPPSFVLRDGTAYRFPPKLYSESHAA